MIAFALVVMLQAQSPSAAGAPPDLNLVTAPNWVRRPSGNDLARLNPSAAKSTGAEGRTITECRVAAGGRLEDCQTLTESPSGLGFGQSSIELMKKFKMDPVDRSGAPVAGRKVKVPVRWYVVPMR